MRIMGVQLTFLFLVVTIVRTQAKIDNGEAASAWTSKRDSEIPAYCSVAPKQDWNALADSDKHGVISQTLDPSAISLEKLFHVSSYQIPEVIENFSVFKTISGCTCAVKDETALCNELLMNQIPSCVGNKTLAVILISRNIPGITAETFKYTPNLEYLNLTRLGLRVQLSNHSFSQLSKLKHLAIQDHGSMPELPEDVFKGLEGLESLYLHNNGLQFLPPNIFAPLTKLRLLNLADNNFRRLPTGIFDKNLELRELILSGNHLKNRYKPQLLRLDLRGNAWNCNCSLMSLSGWTLVHEETVIGKPVCQQPPEVAGMSLQEWFCTYGNVCTTSDLQKDLREFVELTEAIAENHTTLESRNVSHIVSSCFFFGMSSELGSSIELVLGRFVHLLGNIYQRKHGTATNDRGPAPQVDTAVLARQEPTLRFSYIFENIPENIEEAVNAGIEAEIISMFHSSNSRDSAPSTATSNNGIVVGLREEFRRIFSAYKNCLLPHTSRTEMDLSRTKMDISRTEMDISRSEMDISETEMDISETEMEEAFAQSSSAVGFLDFSLYSYLSVLVILSH